MARHENSIPIKGFLETSFLDWPGKIASVIFLPSCNFRCPFCQNVTLVLNPQCLKTWPLPEALQRMKELKDWIDGVCITGGEPTLQATLPDFIRIFKKRNLLVKLDTNGSNPHMIETLLKENLVDAIAMDVKAPLEEISYARLTGVPVDLKAIKKSIDLIRKSPVEKIFRITVVPEMLTEEDIYRVAEDLYPIDKLLLQQFSPENTLDPQLKQETPWPQEKIEEVQRQVDQILTDRKTKPKDGLQKNKR
ncbi:MAG: anaerobic ribonucleoside-triphosphate reductase activating protein [Thermodesulfobacteriota bacterium]|jgi:pyruvate formate lyase activating enzyme|nr:MAG: anaerobic ribonucleoside-triphosphate reductase activating protein [Thermodesulfobacteriota bacterium]